MKYANFDLKTFNSAEKPSFDQYFQWNMLTLIQNPKFRRKNHFFWMKTSKIPITSYIFTFDRMGCDWEGKMFNGFAG